MNKKRFLIDQNATAEQKAFLSRLGRDNSGDAEATFDHTDDKGLKGLGFYTPEAIPNVDPEQSVLNKLEALNELSGNDSNLSAAEYRKLLDIYTDVQKELDDTSKEPDYEALEQRLNGFSNELYQKTVKKEDSVITVVEPAIEPSARALHETADRLYQDTIKKESTPPNLKSVQDRLSTMQKALDDMEKEEKTELGQRREKLEADEANLTTRQERRRGAFQAGMQKVLDGMKAMAEAMGEEESAAA